MSTKGNDVILLQQTSTAIVGAGEGDDRYILDSALLAPNQKITISDLQGSNTLHLVGGLTITGSKVTNNALLLTLSNGAEVTLLGADTFQFLTGGNPLTGQGAQTSTFSDFVTKGLGYTAVPAPGNVAQSTTPVTVNNTGGTSGGGGGGGQTFTLTPASGQVTEGNPLSFTLKAAQKVAADTTFTVVITGDDNGGTVGKASAADFPANVVSSVTIKADSDSATFDLTPVANDGTEGLEGFKVTLLDSANKAVANSGVVLIKDGVTDITPPVINANQSFTYPENQAKGFVVGTVKASDVGAGGGAGTIASFEIVGGNDNGFFAIDKDGKITLTEAGAGKTSAANDFETAPNTFTLKVRAIDAAGNKSADTDVTLTVTDVDDTGPKFVSAAASGTQVKINFDEPLKTVALSNPSALFTVTQGGTSYSVNAATISGNTVTLTLATALGAGDTYIAYDGTVLEDALGNKADKIPSTKVTSTDTTPPTLTSSNPADNATDVPANANLTLTFSEAVKLGTGTITLVNTSDATDNRVINVQDATQVSVSGNTVTINPTADLKENASYAVHISSTAILDSAGNAFAGISDNTTLNFTTKAAPPSTLGQTLLLTTNQDYADTTTAVLNNGAITSSFKFTSANETVNAPAGTLSNTDTLVDGSTTDNDVLNATLTGNAPIAANLTNIETLKLNIAGNKAGLDFTNITGAKTVEVTGTQDAILSNVAATAPEITLTGGYDKTLTVAFATLAGTSSNDPETLKVNLNGAGSKAAVQINIVGTTNTGSLEQLTINSTGTAANTLTVGTTDVDGTSNGYAAANGITKFTVTGDQALTLKVDHATVSTKTLEKTGTGALTLDIDRGTLTTPVTSLVQAAGYANLVLRGSGDVNVSSIANGATVTIVDSFTGANADSLLVKDANTGTNDSLTLKLQHKTAGTNIDFSNAAFAINDVETISIISNGGDSTGHKLGDATNGFEANAAKTINLSGDTKLTLKLATATKFETLNIDGAAKYVVDFVNTGVSYGSGKNVTVNAGTATGDLTLDLSDIVLDTGTSTTETLSVTTGSGKDTLTFGSTLAGAKLVVDAGGGDNTIVVMGDGTGTANISGDVTITTGAGKDTIVFGASATESGGATSLESSSAKVTISTGAGDDVVKLGNVTKNGSMIALGDGSDKVYVGILAGTGTGAATGNTNDVVITTGAGSDTIYLYNPNRSDDTVANNQQIVITDFTAGTGGDVLNLNGWVGTGFATTFGTQTLAVTDGLVKLGAFDQADIANGTNKVFNVATGTNDYKAVAVLFNNNTGLTEVWVAYDNGTNNNIVVEKVATLQNITLAGIAQLTMDNFQFTT
jgi:methionine-rich copper-binding protein CopC